MFPTCPHCGVKYEREPGFFLGSIYINYGLTALISVIVATPILLNRLASEVWVAIGCLVFVVAFPLLWFPWARSLWLGFDQWRDPREPEI
jgi:hypothetical protein